MKKIFALLLILLGIFIMLYPTFTQLYSTIMQERLFIQWEEHAEGGKSELEKSYKNLEQIFANFEGEPSQGSSESVIQQQQSSDGQQPILGILTIKKINLKLPILEGATQENLKIAAGHLEGTAMLGESGNTAIAAHRSRTYGKMFNRLNELEVGDEIIIEDHTNKNMYEVYEILIVEPEDVSVLEGSENEKIVTLITCEPINTGTHRLIIHAKIKKTGDRGQEGQR
jgi:sortase A